jgi:hypothetical protein
VDEEPRSKSKKEDKSSVPSSRIGRIKRALADPNTKLYCYFLEFTNPVFTKVNLLLQRESPAVHILHTQLMSLLSDLLSRFMKPQAISAAECITSVAYQDRKQQKARGDLVIGPKTRMYLREKSESGELTENDCLMFSKSVRSYFEEACRYILSKFPLQDPLWKHAQVLNIASRHEASFSSVQYFMDKFPCLIPQEQRGDVEVEFARFQVSEIHKSILECERVDEQWFQISKLKDGDGNMQYSVLSKVMMGILTIPHSNAASERVFSLVRKNKTTFRPTMGPQTLESLLVTKVHMNATSTACYEGKFSRKVLEKAKKSTYDMKCKTSLQDEEEEEEEPLNSSSESDTDN